MSLAYLSKELWQNIALQVVFDVLNEYDGAHKLPFPDSLLPTSINLERSKREGSSATEMGPQDPSRSAPSCTSVHGRLSGQTKFCYRECPPHRKSTILALLAICRRLRADLIGLQPLWSKIALMFPQFLPDCLNWAGNGLEYPYRLESIGGVCSCVFAMLLPRVRRATHLRIALPLKRSYGRHPSQQVFDVFRSVPTPQIEHLEMRYDPFYDDTSEIAVDEFDSIGLPSIKKFVGMNNPHIAYGPRLTVLRIAFETRDIAPPAHWIARVLIHSSLLEEVSLQMALGNGHLPDSMGSIPLPRLRYLLLCDQFEHWHPLRNKMSLPKDVSFHADVVVPSSYHHHAILGSFAERTARDCLPWFTSGKFVILDYCEVRREPHSPTFNWPEYLRMTFAETEIDVWTERDPDRLSQRCSLSFRFRGPALATRYPAPELEGLRAPSAGTILGDILLGAAKASRATLSLNFANTEVLVDKAGRRSQHNNVPEAISIAFPNLHTLCIYGVYDRQSHAAQSLVRGLTSRVWAHLERVRLPDWDDAESVWEVGSRRIEGSSRRGAVNTRGISWTA
ncbi:unnamed protein product [Peniophora sp. CBMAI 1063]|nr:unnamed protein product [Peniophora sp. CBMAI 1063]